MRSRLRILLPVLLPGLPVLRRSLMMARRSLFGLVLVLALGACLDRSRSDPGPIVEPTQAVLGAEPDVNAPVAPEAIYVGREGGLSIVDLDGFGEGTGELPRTH